jgi:hypothetical protein
MDCPFCWQQRNILEVVYLQLAEPLANLISRPENQ